MLKNLLTQKENPKIWVISDTHLIANELHDKGWAFQKMQNTSVGKDLHYQQNALLAFTRKVLKEKPDVVVVTGDITFNGERLSMQRFAEIFAPLKRHGIKLLVLPGNHDIYDGWARKFKDDVQYRTDQVSPQDFKEIFYDSSYRYAAREDGSSLAYSVNLSPRYRLILADSNIYPMEYSLTHPHTHGQIDDEELAFIESQIIEAESNHQHVLFFMHHNLYRHNAVIYHNFVLDNASQVKRLFNKYNVQAVFSGHIHAQSIKKEADCSAYEVVTSCFSSTDQGYGEISLNDEQLCYTRHSFNMDDYLAPAEKHGHLNNYRQYLWDLFEQNNRYHLRYLDNMELVDEEKAKIARFLGDMHWDYFVGKGGMTKEQIINSEEYRRSIEVRPKLKGYIDSLIVDSDNWNLKINWKNKWLE